MFRIRIRSQTAIVTLTLLLGAGACAKQNKAAQASARAEATSGQFSQTESLRATVQSVDDESRTVTLRDEDGRPFIVEAGKDVELSRLHPSDTVLVVYQEAVAFELQDPAEASGEEPVTVQEATRRKIADGVQFGRRIRTTVQIVSVAPDGAVATFRIPEGGIRTVQVADARNQEKVANLKPGDSVDVTYTERLNVSVDPSSKK